MEKKLSWEKKAGEKRKFFSKKFRNQGFFYY